MPCVTYDCSESMSFGRVSREPGDWVDMRLSMVPLVVSNPNVFLLLVPTGPKTETASSSALCAPVCAFGISGRPELVEVAFSS